MSDPPEFQVGDKVRCVLADNTPFEIGAIYTIQSVDHFYGCVALEEAPQSGEDYSFDRFKLVARPVGAAHWNCGSCGCSHIFGSDAITCCDSEKRVKKYSMLEDLWTQSIMSTQRELEKEAKKMELEHINKDNLQEAKSQYEKECKNAEIEYAKGQLSAATDEILALDRQIKALEARKKPFQEIIDYFNK